MENIADRGTIGPRKFFMLAERKKKEEKGGKKEKKEKERKKRRKGKKENRKKERVTAPVSIHFVQGQTLVVGGAPQKIYK